MFTHGSFSIHSRLFALSSRGSHEHDCRAVRCGHRKFLRTNNKVYKYVRASTLYDCICHKFMRLYATVCDCMEGGGGGGGGGEAEAAAAAAAAEARRRRWRRRAVAAAEAARAEAARAEAARAEADSVILPLGVEVRLHTPPEACSPNRPPTARPCPCTCRIVVPMIADIGTNRGNLNRGPEPRKR